MRIAGVIFLLVAAGVITVLVLSVRRWQARSSRLVQQLMAPGSRAPSTYSAEELGDLPGPVVRYFRAVLRDGQRIIRHVRLEQEGEFLLKAPDGWRPFTAVQHIDPVGFVWDARIRMMPGVSVLVRDGFVAGTGSMHAGLFGLITIVSREGSPEIASAALMRYLAEAVWCPTALLPSQGVRWGPVDDSTARATLSVGPVTVSLDYRFGADGLVRGIYAPERGRDVNGTSVPTPWQGRWSEWGEQDGVRIPLRGEVEWVLPEGPQPYWRGRVASICFDPVGSGSR
jgi:hypothetical protein